MKIDGEDILIVDITDEIVKNNLSSEDITKLEKTLIVEIEKLEKKFDEKIRITSYGHFGEIIEIRYKDKGIMKDIIVKIVKQIYA